LNNKLRPAEGTSNHYYVGPVDVYDPSITPASERSRFWEGYPTAHILNFPEDTFEIFSYCAQSQARALGTYAATGGIFNSSNLQTFAYDDKKYAHSRQFLSNIADEWGYWSDVIDDALLPAN
jgi:hypothetical protein